jgi:hypothetical protein
MALNPVGSGSSLAVSTDTAKVIAAGIAQQAKYLKGYSCGCKWNGRCSH